jgi:toxin ParE2
VKPIAYSRIAQKELGEIVRYYNSRQKGLGTRFREELVDVLESIRRTPQAFGYDSLTDTRTKGMRRFSYTIHYLEETRRIVIIAIAHQHRRTGYWLQQPIGHPHSP